MTEEQRGAQAEQLVAFFQALADVTRLKIVGLLAQGEKNVDELVSALEVRQPTVSHHLSKLRMLGLVSLRKEGQVHYYSLDTGVIQRMARQVLSTDGLKDLAPQEGGTVWERKVLQHFFAPDGTLKELPTQRTKRDVVLRRLVMEFEEGRQYPESEVNAILKRFHPDVAWIRREFVMTKMMERENGVYWRI